MAARDATTASTAQGTAVASAWRGADQRSRTSPVTHARNWNNAKGQAVQGEQIAWKLGLERRRADGRDRKRPRTFTRTNSRRANRSKPAKTSPPSGIASFRGVHQPLTASPTLCGKILRFDFTRRTKPLEVRRACSGNTGIDVREQIARIAHVEPNPRLCLVAATRAARIPATTLTALIQPFQLATATAETASATTARLASLRSAWSTTQAASRAMPAVLAS